MRTRALIRGHAGAGSLVLMGERILKPVIFVLGILTVLGNLGFNMSTTLAGLGIGGLAIGFGAQKTIENLFGGVSVLGDEVFRVGDVCRFGDRTGVVEDIGLRSTRIRTDDRTLVLADITNVHPPRRTRLVVLDTGRLRPRARIELRGFYTVDAISPTGRWLYLIHYRSSNTNDYEVRAYDLARRRLLARPVVDPREPDEKMQGTPLTRTMTTDGRWAYTLYVRGSGALFIHALDTATRRAFCVDVPAPSGADLSTVHLALAPSATLRIDVAGDRWLADLGFGSFGLVEPLPLEIGEFRQFAWKYRRALWKSAR